MTNFTGVEINYQKTMASSQDVMKEFIDIYRENPCLWKLSHPDHRNRHVKHTALLKLLDCVRKEEPDADLARVKFKINNIRTSFKREVRKVELCKMAEGEGQAYSPKLWYYGMLWFILEAEKENDQILGRLRGRNDAVGTETRSRADESIPSPSSDTNRAGTCGSFTLKKYEIETSESSKSDLSNTTISPSRRHAPLTNPLHINIHNRRNISEKPDKALRGRLIRNKLFKSSDKKPDEYDFVGKLVATKLRRLPDRMSIIAEKLIHDVLYQAQLNDITVDSNIVTSDADVV